MSTFPIGRAILMSSIYSVGILATALGMIAHVSPGSSWVVWLATMAILLPASMLVGTLLAVNFHFLGHAPVAAIASKKLPESVPQAVGKV